MLYTNLEQSGAVRVLNDSWTKLFSDGPKLQYMFCRPQNQIFSHIIIGQQRLLWDDDDEDC